MAMALKIFGVGLGNQVLDNNADDFMLI